MAITHFICIKTHACFNRSPPGESECRQSYNVRDIFRKISNCTVSKYQVDVGIKPKEKLSYGLETARHESLPKIAEIRCITEIRLPSNVLQGHQKWHQSKANVCFPISSL